MVNHDKTPEQRLDKWLWHARFYKTRSLASKTIKAKRIRLNGSLVSKASVVIKKGDVLTFIKADQFRVIEVVDMVEARVSAPLANTLYLDSSPPVVKRDPFDPRNAKTPTRPQGEGRPTKADRRAIDRLHNKD